MKELLYLKDEQIKDFIEKIFYAYRETFSDPKKILNKYSFGVAHLKVLNLISRYEGITISKLLIKCCASTSHATSLTHEAPIV